MKITEMPFTVTDWNAIVPVEHKGERGTSFWRVFESGNVRTRVVEYSSGYRSDHWCPRGHVLYVLEGEFGVLLKDGRDIRLGPGSSFEAGDDETNPHLGYSEKGARVFIVD
jgi:quercetin dioxygenase-like cupin family protein